MTSTQSNPSFFILSVVSNDALARRCNPNFIIEVNIWFEENIFIFLPNVKAKLLDDARSIDNKLAILDMELESLLQNPSFSKSFDSYFQAFENQNNNTQFSDSQFFKSTIENAVIGSTIQAGSNIQIGNSNHATSIIHGDQVQGNKVGNQVSMGANSIYVEKIEGNNNIVGNNNTITLQQGSRYFEAAAKNLDFLAPEEKDLEKILGSKSHLLKISWLAKGLQAAKSVCRVVLSNGTKGTGFVLKGGYLLTNCHILPTPNAATTAKIEFDFEEDIDGKTKQIATYYLDGSTFKSSSILKLDYAFVKIKDNSTRPLAEFGYLELNTFSEPQQGEPINIIQHPNGESKQIALTYNEVLGIVEHRLLYSTDTDKGSSGSPAFDNDWKVIALHHAGKTSDEGGLKIDLNGNKKAANEGILMKYIAQELGI